MSFIQERNIVMKNNIYLIAGIFFLFPFQKAAAQDYFYKNNHINGDLFYEAGASFGIMNCLTDLGGHRGSGKTFIKDLNLGNTEHNGSIYAGLTYKDMLGLRLEATYGQVKAYDSILKDNARNSYGRYERNLSFESKISEISLLATFYPLGLIQNTKHYIITPYFIGGIGFFSFNPQTTLNGRTVDLQPLSTEGEGFAEYPDRIPYRLMQFNFPVGMGFLHEASKHISIRAEFIYRILFTDYLDDVSKTYIDPSLFSKYFSGQKLSDALALNNRNRRNNPSNYPGNSDAGQVRGTKNKDAYFTLNMKIGYTFGRKKVAPPLNCPF